jgi:hypothetical protein
MPATLLTVQGHDGPVDASGVRFGLDWLGMAAHGDCLRMSTPFVTSPTGASIDVVPAQGG